MSTVVRRTFKATPARDASQTWAEMVSMLTRVNSGARQELESVAGIASSLIADQSPKNAAITVTCDGTRTRIYCLYDDDAIDGSGANEEQLAYDPLAGGWKVSFPCQGEDLSWVQGALAQKSDRITARDLAADVEKSEPRSAQSAGLTLDLEGFLGQ
jgi:hypothetical protein